MSSWDAIQFSLNNNIGKLPVIKNNKLLGLVTQTDLVKQFNEFLKDIEFAPGNIPQVREAMSDQYLMAWKEETLFDISIAMINEGIYSVIIGDEKTHKIKGYITQRDVLAEIFKNPLVVKKLKITQFMNPSIESITPGIDVFKANRMMISKNLRSLPVVLNNEVAGIITQKDIIKQLGQFLSYVYKKHGRVR